VFDYIPICYQYYLLVGGFNLSEKYEFVSWDYSSQYMESHKSHVPIHQPDIILDVIINYITIVDDSIPIYRTQRLDKNFAQWPLSLPRPEMSWPAVRHLRHSHMASDVIYAN